MKCISVIVPALNNADTIQETLLSCLTEPEVGEVIVVLAPSTDSTDLVVSNVKDDRVRLVQPSVKGIARQMNIGVSEARFEYTCKLDSDDIIVGGRFGKQVNFLRENSDYVAIAGAHLTIDMKGTVLWEPRIRYEPGDVTDLYLRTCEVAHLGTLLIRTHSVKEAGGFREWFVMSEDFDFSFRLAGIGKIWLSDHPAYGFRIRPNSITHSKPLAISQFYAEAAREFCRQRAARGSDDLEDGTPPSLPVSLNGERAKPFDPRIRASGYLAADAWKCFDSGQKRKAFLQILKAIRISPGKQKLQTLRSLAAMFVKSFI